MGSRVWACRAVTTTLEVSNMPRRKAPLDGLLLVGILVVFIQCHFAGCEPIPIIPPGCHNLCVKLGGTFLECIKQCPSNEVCVKAMTTVNLTETYMGDGPIQRPQLCKPHCWEANIYTERRCMLDCPQTWCVQYGGLTTTTAPPTTTTTMMTTTPPTTTLAPSTTTTAKAPTLGNALGQQSSGTNVAPVLGGSTGKNDTGLSGQSVVSITLEALLGVSLLVIGIVAAYYGYRKYRARKASQPVKEDNIPMATLTATNQEETVTFLRS